jgi:putative membrane protein insertion efficiency factor
MKKEERRMPNANAPQRVLYYLRLLPSAFGILLVRLYRLILSPFIAFLAGPSGACRFEPSCSQYAIEALKTHGAITGSWLAAKRVCRCHPGAAGGEDPVPPKPQIWKQNPTLDEVADPSASARLTTFNASESFPLRTPRSSHGS